MLVGGVLLPYVETSAEEGAREYVSYNLIFGVDGSHCRDTTTNNFIGIKIRWQGKELLDIGFNSQTKGCDGSCNFTAQTNYKCRDSNYDNCPADDPIHTYFNGACYTYEPILGSSSCHCGS